ncbi:MAG: hypothetical protein ACYTBY_11680, partial [Planctomycetota bacterium]
MEACARAVEEAAAAARAAAAVVTARKMAAERAAAKKTAEEAAAKEVAEAQGEAGGAVRAQAGRADPHPAPSHSELYSPSGQPGEAVRRQSGGGAPGPAQGEAGGVGRTQAGGADPHPGHRLYKKRTQVKYYRENMNLRGGESRVGERGHKGQGDKAKSEKHKGCCCLSKDREGSQRLVRQKRQLLLLFLFQVWSAGWVWQGGGANSVPCPLPPLPSPYFPSSPHREWAGRTYTPTNRYHDRRVRLSMVKEGTRTELTRSDLTEDRERQRERERDRERKRETERDRERQRETDKDRERQRETERQREKDRERQRDRERETERERDRETERQRETERDREGQRETERQRDRERQRTERDREGQRE